jgi:hypothetical protein
MSNRQLAVSRLSFPPKISSAVEELKSLQVIEDVGEEGNTFPKACIFFLRTLPGNEACLSCGVSHPTYAHTPFGILLCGRCKDNHMTSLGARVSCSRIYLLFSRRLANKHIHIRSYIIVCPTSLVLFFSEGVSFSTFSG